MRRGLKITAWSVAVLVALIVLAALQTIPSELFQAAAIDGAGPWTRFWKITFPHILGPLTVVLILRMMRNGIVLIGVPGLAYNIFIGAIILGMMALHSWLERRHHAGT